MQRIILFLLLMGLAFQVYSQTLEIPTNLTQRQDTSYWGGNIPFYVNQWILAGWIGYADDLSTDEISRYQIKDKFNATNTELNEIKANGGNITNWPFYLRTTDSTFLADTVARYVGGNDQQIEGRNTITQKTWGQYYDEGHEIYYNTFNEQYYLLATDDLGNYLDLETVINIRNDYANIGGYVTIKGLSGVNQANLQHRSTW